MMILDGLNTKETLYRMKKMEKELCFLETVSIIEAILIKICPMETEFSNALMEI